MFLPLQEAWIKDFTPVANVITNVGLRAVQTLEKMEKDGCHLTAGLLRRAFEGMPIPEDQDEVFSRLDKKSGKLTASMLSDFSRQVKQDRMWTWVICHPQPPESVGDPSRSMFTP